MKRLVGNFFNCSIAFASVKKFPSGSLNICLLSQLEQKKVDESYFLLAHFRGHLHFRHLNLY